MAAAVESWTAAAPEPEAGEHRVTSLELFFDLVFVFAITQVTAMLVADPTWGGLARGMLVLAALWWAWVGYAWLTNTIDPDIVVNRLTVFASMAAVLVVSLAVPGAFAGDATLFAVAYLLVRVVHLALYARGSHDRAEWAAVARLAPTATIAPLLLLLASAFDGALQGAIWIAALLIDYSGPLRIRGWRVDAGHFAERHGLIILIALGESLVALGVGARELELSAAAIAAAVLGITALSALWWAYFDVVAIVAERRLRAATGDARAAMARDSYSYLHLPMVAGIVLLAFGIEQAVTHDDAPLTAVPAAALYGGVALYLVAHVAFRLRNVRSLNRRRLVVAALCLACIPLGEHVDALASLAILAALLAGLVTYEAVRFREARAAVRSIAQE